MGAFSWEYVCMYGDMRIKARRRLDPENAVASVYFWYIHGVGARSLYIHIGELGPIFIYNGQGYMD